MSRTWRRFCLRHRQRVQKKPMAEGSRLRILMFRSGCFIAASAIMFMSLCFCNLRCPGHGMHILHPLLRPQRFVCIRASCHLVCVLCMLVVYGVHITLTHKYSEVSTNVCIMRIKSEFGTCSMHVYNQPRCIYLARLFCSARSWNGSLSSPADADTRTRTHTSHAPTT